MEGRSLNLNCLVDTVLQQAAIQGVVMPKTTGRRLKDIAGADFVMESPRDVLPFCKKIQKALEANRELYVEFGPIFGQIRQGINIALLTHLGIDEYFEMALGNTDLSPRETIKLYLSTLQNGEEWSQKSFTNWRGPDGTTGSAVLQQVRNITGGISDEVIIALLGSDSNEQLAVHPFKPSVTRLRDQYDIARYLEEFLLSLAPGQNWKPADLGSWRSKDGMEGDKICKWLRANMGDLNSRAINTILGAKKAGAYHFEKQEKRINSLARARKFLCKFLISLPEAASWSSQTLKEYVSTDSDDPKGESLRSWIERNGKGGKVSDESAREVLGPKNVYLLEQHPFVVQRRITITNRSDARRALEAYIDRLPDGATWSPTDLQLAVEIGQAKTPGYSIYFWIEANMPGDFTDETLKELLQGDKSGRLVRNPLRRRNPRGKYRE